MSQISPEFRQCRFPLPDLLALKHLVSLHLVFSQEGDRRPRYDNEDKSLAMLAAWLDVEYEKRGREVTLRVEYEEDDDSKCQCMRLLLVVAEVLYGFVHNCSRGQWAKFVR